MPDQTVVTTTESLRRMLRAVLPAASLGFELPTFRCVRLHMAQTALCATATDRYALAQARCEATGTMPPVLLDRGDVKRILRTIRPDGGSRSVVLSVGEDGSGQTLTVRLVTVARDGVSVTVNTRDYQWPEEGLRELAAKIPTRQVCGTDKPLAFDIWNMERLLRGLRRVATKDRGSMWISDKRWGYTVRVFVGRPDQPTRIECGDWFVAIVQPVERDSNNHGYADRAGVPLEFFDAAAGDRVAAGSGDGAADGPTPDGRPAATHNEAGDGNG